MNPCVKTEGKCNKLVNNEFKITRERDSLHQRMRERANNETNSPYSCLVFLIHYFNIINSLKSEKIHYILIQYESHSL